MRSSPHPRLLFAHRGAAVEQPENTMPSFERALEVGADVLELDVHMTADGHIVVSHDATGRRMAGVNARFRDVTLADVKRWDAGYGFVDATGDRRFVGKGITVPTLEQVLVEFPGVPLNVDLKQVRPSIIGPVCELLARTRDSERVTIASFHARVTVSARRRGYPGPTALSRPEAALLLSLPALAWRRQWQLLGGQGNAAQVPPRVGPLRFDTRAMIAKCHALGMRVDFWTIDDPREAARLLDLGADGIMTNDPAAIKPVFDERG